MIVDDDLIAKFLSGEASPEEAMAIHDWLKTSANRDRFDEMAATWNQARPSRSFRAVNTNKAWRKVRPARSIAWPIGIAASILLLIFIGIQFSRRESAPLTAKLSSGDSTMRVTLADKSEITLNRNSEIAYQKEFTETNRVVSLIKGEAFFKVARDAKRPFIVSANFSRITVVGTEFNVQSSDDAVEVGVNEGVVLVVTPFDSVYVRQGSTVIFRKSEKAVSAQNNPNVWAYATHKLVFKDTRMNAVVDELEKAYSCTISVSNVNVNNCKLTGSFSDKSVENVLLLISETLNLKLEQNGQVYTLEGDGCP